MTQRTEQTEEEIVRKINTNDKENQYCVRLHDSFYFKKNYCMVFESLGLSLFELIKKNKYTGKIAPEKPMNKTELVLLRI